MGAALFPEGIRAANRQLGRVLDAPQYKGRARGLYGRMSQDPRIEKIVVGLPLSLRGEKGRMAEEVERFARQLRKRSSVPVVLWDERFTSVQARRVLRQAGEKVGRKKGKVDCIASVLLLQNYLDFQHVSVKDPAKEKD